MQKMILVVILAYLFNTATAEMQNSGIHIATCEIKAFDGSPTDMDVYLGRQAEVGFIQMNLFPSAPGIENSGKYLEIVKVKNEKDKISFLDAGEGGSMSFTLPKLLKAKTVEVKTTEQTMKCLVRSNIDRLF